VFLFRIARVDIFAEFNYDIRDSEDILPLISIVMSEKAKPGDHVYNANRKKLRTKSWRKNFSSYSYEELQNLVKSKLSEPTTSKIEDLSVFDIIQNRKQTRKRITTTNSCIPLDQYVPVSLKFNEATFSTISNWVFNPKADIIEDRPVPSHYGINPRHVYRNILPEPLFRRCSVCERWGHYDDECPNLDKDMLEYEDVAKRISLHYSRKDHLKSLKDDEKDSASRLNKSSGKFTLRLVRRLYCNY